MNKKELINYYNNKKRNLRIKEEKLKTEQETLEEVIADLEELQEDEVVAELPKEQHTFNTLTWQEINKIVESGDAPKYFNVGDIKEVVLVDGNKRDVVIIGINQYGQSITCQFLDVLFDAAINEENTNEGGFAASKLNEDLKVYAQNTLPVDLFSVLKTVTKDGVNNKLFLLSEKEVFGKANYSKDNNDVQYEYFKNKKTRVKWEHEVEYSRWWWLRSPHASYSGYFVIVGSGGGVYGSGASGSGGVAPCFVI